MKKILAYSMIIFVLYAIIAATMSWKSPLHRLVMKIPFGDKLMHALLLCGVTYSVNILLNSKKISVLGKSVLLGSLGVFVFCTVEEFSQYFVPTRTFDLIDLFANYVGIFLGSYFYLKINK